MFNISFRADSGLLPKDEGKPGVPAKLGDRIPADGYRIPGRVLLPNSCDCCCIHCGILFEEEGVGDITSDDENSGV